jgi:hypothetical protein
MQARKKDKERFYLNLFKEAFVEFPSGTLEDGETPDFCVINGNTRIGIELTELFRPVTVNEAPLQQRESFLFRLARNASDIHQKRGLPPVVVTAFVNPHHKFRQADMRQMAGQLAAIVERNLPEAGQSREEEYTYDNRGYFPETIHHVIVRRYPGVDENVWSCPEAAWIPDCGPELIQATLDNKQSRYAACRGKCGAVWLVMLTETRGLASFVRFTPAAMTHLYSASFERIFVFKAGREIIELRRR